MGELTKELPKAKGARGIGTSAVTRGNRTTPTLADRGITKKQSSRWQALAAIPAEQFEEHVERTKAKAECATFRLEVIEVQSMPRTPSENTFQLSLKVPQEWVSLADDIAVKMSQPGVALTRTDALRAALWAGLQQLSTGEPKKGSKR